MRILHVIASLAPRRGGPAKVAPEMCRALAQLGHEVELFTTNADGPGVLDVPTDRPVALGGATVRYFPIGRPRRWGASLALGRALRDGIRRFDVVHIHSLYLFHTLVAAHYCRRYGVPYLVRPHGTFDPFLRRKSRFKKALYGYLIEKRNLDGAAAIHYTSQDEMLLAHGPMGIRAPGVVVPLGIYPEEYASLPPRGDLRARFPETAGKFVVLYLGRLNYKKGLDLLVQAYARLARVRDDVHLVLAGPDDDGYGAQVRQWLLEERVLDRATFAGMLVGRAKLEALAGADVFALPSYSENFGVAVVEAMACGLPVVISNKVNIWHEIAAAEAGIVVDCAVEQVAAALAALAGDAGQRQCLGDNGRRLVEDAYTWGKVAVRLSGVYEAILKPR